MILRLLLTLWLLLFIVLPVKAELKAESRPEPLYIYAAISLQDSLQTLKKIYESQQEDKIILVLAGTAVIARQIANGAKADIFISAHPMWTHYLQQQGHLLPQSQRVLAHNRLVLVGPKTLLQRGSLEQILKKGLVAMGHPKAVPAGLYAKQALASLDLWESIRPVFAHNVRLALAWTARGDTLSGIVYKSDAQADPRVRIIHTFSDSHHEPIFYTAALLRGHNPRARPFYDFLQSPAAHHILTQTGFLIPSHP